MSDGEFENASSGAALTVPSQASGIKKNGYMIIKGRPCKVVDCSTSKTGKHGSAKVHFTAIDIFNGKKYEEISPSTHNLQVPIINRTEWTLVDVSEDGYVSLMSADGSLTKEDIKLPADEPEISQKIREAVDNGTDMIVAVLAAMGEEKIVAAKESN
jgi:translation initiation factor 5A